MIEPAYADDEKNLCDLLEKFVGQESKFSETTICRDVIRSSLDLLQTDRGLGFSQFNELLLQLGYDRVASELFQFLLDGTTDYQGGCVSSFETLKEGVIRFRKLSLLWFGNVKFGYKTLASAPDLLEQKILRQVSPTKFKGRHQPALDIKKIAGDETYYLGYLVQSQIKTALEQNPQDEQALLAEAKRKQIVQQGVYNHEVYLCFDHMDVYVATSMREPHEYALVNKWSDEIFRNGELAELNVRWFDPTQAYCNDRIDKGLAEALMLKRAFCTIYFAQESDTLGKDSELASTLAQGKPVIAYVPNGGPQYVRNLCELLRNLNKNESLTRLLLDQLRLFDSRLAWTDASVMKWVADPSCADEADVIQKLETVTKVQYDRRAKLLKESHPLGIQVHLDTGVANGVLVVRSLDDCARLIRRVLLNELEFEIEEKSIDDKTYVLLTETISQSVFRVMTGDAKLTNSFWNFYLS